MHTPSSEMDRKDTGMDEPEIQSSSARDHDGFHRDGGKQPTLVRKHRFCVVKSTAPGSQYHSPTASIITENIVNDQIPVIPFDQPSPVSSAPLTKDGVPLPVRRSSKAASICQANTFRQMSSPSKPVEAQPRTHVHEPRAVTYVRPVWGRQISEGLFSERWHVGHTIIPWFGCSNAEVHPIVVSGPISPLRPPILPTISDQTTSSHGTVKVEASFTKPALTDNEIDNQASQQATGKGISRRKKLLDPRSWSLLRLRSSSGRRGASAQSSTKTASRPLRHHPRSGWRRDNTAGGLLQASLLLAELVANKPASRIRSEQSFSSGLSKLRRVGTQYSGARNHVLPVERVQSMELVSGRDSDDSSLAVLQMGSPPPNTPEERATYRVKRSPSRDTEVFLKIDISIRGGTSYLPSEARRIHTPPPPKAGPDGKQRGFFFDYHIDTDEKGLESVGWDTMPSSKLPSGDAEAGIQAGTSSRVIKARNIDPDIQWQRQKKRKDWYSMQLAELDLSYEDEGGEQEEARVGAGAGAVTDHHHGTFLEQTSRTSTFTKQQHQPQMNNMDQSRLDYSIPEHLPSSPLCPRHPRYWRVVRDGANHHFRGCWMHGGGEISMNLS